MQKIRIYWKENLRYSNLGGKRMNYYLIRLSEYLGDHSAEVNELVVSDKPLSYTEIQT